MAKHILQSGQTFSVVVNNGSSRTFIINADGTVSVPANFYIAIGGFNGIFTHANSADRTYTMPNRTGNVALEDNTSLNNMLPSQGGNSGKFLQTNATTTSWATAMTSLNGLSDTSQTFATPGTTGTAPAWTSASGVHTLNIPMASASSVTAGLISHTDYTNIAFINVSNTFGGTQVFTNAPTITNTSTASNAAATYGQIQTATAGLSIRKPVAALDTSDVTKPTVNPVIDGYTIALNDRVLFTNLSSGNNEVYKATSALGSVVWVLETDGQAGDGTPTKGDILFVDNGTVHAFEQWAYEGSSWVKYSAAAELTFSTGLTNTANTITVDQTFAPSWTGTHTFSKSPASNTSVEGIVLTDPVPAPSSGNQQYSPRVRWTGQGWKTNATAGSQTVDFFTQLVPVQGTASPSSYLDFQSQVNGGGYTNRLSLFSSGGMSLGSTTDPGAGVFNVSTGFQVAGAATTGNVLRGNGTNFVSATLAAADLSNGVTGSGAVVLASGPTLTGVPLAPTASPGTNTTQIATTAFVFANSLSNPMTTSGDIIYGASAGAATRLPANSTGTNKYLQSVSSGIPAWVQIAFSDLSGIATTAQIPATITQAESFILTNATTAAVDPVLTIGHDSSGTAANNFGLSQRFQLASSTTNDTDVGNVTVSWVNATHASRKARLVLNIYDTAVREGLRIEASGTAPMIGFLGASASAALASPDLGTLATTFGLATGTPTFAAANLTGTLAAAQFPALTGDATTPAGSLAVSVVSSTLTNSTTAAADTVFSIIHNSSGTPAAGFGSIVKYQLKTSTTTSVDAADDTTTWVVATHASRTARKVFNIYDTVAREAFRIEASGSAPMIGFLGAAAVVRQTGDAGTALVTLGLMSGTPTFAAANLTGTLAAAQFPALTGDTTTSAGSLATTTSSSTLSDGTTTTAPTVFTINHTSSGTPAAGFGSTTKWTLKTSTTTSVDAADDTTTWVVATHASRTARKVFNIYDTAVREAIRIEASGTAAMVGFLGHTASAQLVSPDAGTALVTFGLASGTPTFAAANLTGTLAAAQFPTLTGDVTTPGASLATTVAAISGTTTNNLALINNTATLADNTSSATLVTGASYATATSRSVRIEYQLSRGSGNYTIGYIRLLYDGTNARITYIEDDNVGTTGVTFTADINGGNMRLLYTTTSTGVACTMLYKQMTFIQ